MRLIGGLAIDLDQSQLFVRQGPDRLYICDSFDSYSFSYEWVGWRNTSHPNPEITFEFDSLRNFTSLGFHVNNYFTNNVEIFDAIEVQFSIRKGHFSPRSIYTTIRPDSDHQDARWITVNLGNRVAQWLKVGLIHRGKWVLVSEVSFESGTFMK